MAVTASEAGRPATDVLWKKTACVILNDQICCHMISGPPLIRKSLRLSTSAMTPLGMRALSCRLGKAPIAARAVTTRRLVDGDRALASGHFVRYLVWTDLEFFERPAPIPKITQN